MRWNSLLIGIGSATNPDVLIVEMDSVDGRIGGKVIITLYYRNCSLMLIVWYPSKPVNYVSLNIPDLIL